MAVKTLLKVSLLGSAIALMAASPAFAGSQESNRTAVLQKNVVTSMPGTSTVGYLGNGFIENAPFQFKRGIHHFKSGNYADASQHFGRILRYSPRDPMANYYMGVSKQKLGNHRKAIRHLKFSRYMFAGVAEVHAALGQSLVAEGRIDEARKVLADIEALDRGCADICKAQGRIDTAKKIMTTALGG